VNRINTFTFRVSQAERRLIEVVAQQLDRTESDAVRYLLREKARELGVTSVALKSDRHVAQPAT
jgi:hypothetical protein